MQATDWRLAIFIPDLPLHTLLALPAPTSLQLRLQDRGMLDGGDFADDLIEASMLGYLQEVSDKFCRIAESFISFPIPQVLPSPLVQSSAAM